MRRFEYKKEKPDYDRFTGRIVIDQIPHETLEDVFELIYISETEWLTREGSEGWELIRIDRETFGKGGIYLFKREVRQ